MLLLCCDFKSEDTLKMYIYSEMRVCMWVSENEKERKYGYLDWQEFEVPHLRSEIKRGKSWGNFKREKKEKIRRVLWEEKMKTERDPKWGGEEKRKEEMYWERGQIAEGGGQEYNKWDESLCTQLLTNTLSHCTHPSLWSGPCFCTHSPHPPTPSFPPFCPPAPSFFFTFYPPPLPSPLYFPLFSIFLPSTFSFSKFFPSHFFFTTLSINSL